MVLIYDHPNNSPLWNQTHETVRFAPGMKAKVDASVGFFEPETYAVLGGYLNDPLRVTDVMPMPPASDGHGRGKASRSTVTLNAAFLEHYLNTSLLPFGKYFLGVMHSHPGGMNFLSDGAPGSGYGDIPSMRQHLEAAARLGEPWHTFIAPIVTYPGRSPRVDTWLIRLDSPSPIRAETVWEEEPSSDTPSDLDDILDLVCHRPDLVMSIIQRSDKLKSILRSHRARDEHQAKLVLKRLLDRRRGRV
ncbi:hypothetical protein ELH27_37060 [Rhizobium leguminosarum]|uniref:JAB domain-containing protein n=1 Tax=Rhizobium beringeri TaxID=3019934 RepID=A0ABY1XH43_9HYPH|nr:MULTISPECIES: hypothetical protein [Rhizobium]TBC53779.1 hypothetical protein ELH27_37060 [Rhizobium leguminosarum]TBE57588.1 hypothetical protein ELH03_37015 [Rhizobium beringeri]